MFWLDRCLILVFRASTSMVKVSAFLIMPQNYEISIEADDD